MLALPIKKSNQMWRHMCVLSSFDCSNLNKAPYNVSQFLKQMPKKLNFIDIKNEPIVHEIDALSSENKNLMLAHVLNSAGGFSPFGSKTTLKIKAEILMAMVYLIRAGANPDTLINYWHDSPALILAYEAHFYPLRIALELNNIKFIRFLLNHGANVHGPEYKGSFFVEPIFYAEKVKTAKVLFKYGLNLDSKDHDYSQIIDSAICNKPLELIKLYLSHGANPSVIGCRKDTILHRLASSINNSELLQITEFFISIAPHTINAVDANGDTPLDTAEDCQERVKWKLETLTKSQEFIALLKKNGAKTKQALKNLE